MKFLIIQTAFIGDVILATPLIEKLHSFFPGAQIDFLLRKGNEGLLEGHPKLNKVLVWDKKSGKTQNGFKILQQIRAERYDWVFNCQRFFSSGFFTVFSGAKNTVGFDKNPLSWLFSKKIAHRFGTVERPIHEVSRNLSLVENLTDSAFVRPKLYPQVADYQRIAEFQELPVSGKLTNLQTPRYITIAPTSVWFTKQFPGGKWAEFLKSVSPETAVFLLGGKADFDACEKIRLDSGHPKTFNLSGKLSFLQSAALMSGAAMNYVNDSAPMHMASAMNAPVTTVFCSTVPEFGFGPLSDRSFVVQTLERLDCRPCGLHGFKTCPKKHFRCAENIDVQLLLPPDERF